MTVVALCGMAAQHVAEAKPKKADKEVQLAGNVMTLVSASGRSSDAQVALRFGYFGELSHIRCVSF